MNTNEIAVTGDPAGLDVHERSIGLDGRIGCKFLQLPPWLGRSPVPSRSIMFEIVG